MTMQNNILFKGCSRRRLNRDCHMFTFSILPHPSHTHTHTHTHAHRGLYFIRKLSRTASWEAWITPSEPVYVCGCMCIAVILSPQYDKNKCFGHIEKRSKQMSDLWWNTFSFFKFRGIIINVTNPSSNLPCVRTLVTLVTSLDKC